MDFLESSPKPVMTLLFHFYIFHILSDNYTTNGSCLGICSRRVRDGFCAAVNYCF